MTTVEEAVDAYVAAWNEDDPGRRRALLSRSAAADCVYEGPAGRACGRDQLDAAIAEARDFVPGASVRRIGDVTMVGDEARFSWAIDGPDGSQLMQGTDVVTTAEDGRLRHIAVLPRG